LKNNSQSKKSIAAMLDVRVQSVHAILVRMHGFNRTRKPQVLSVKNECPDVMKAIQNKYNECYEIARSKGYDLPEIPIRWNIRGARVAGRFSWSNNGSYFEVNLQLAKHNLESYLKRTPMHEFAHYIVKKYYPMGKGHGHHWKMVMRRVFELSPERCHQYDTSNLRKTFKYVCSCDEHQLTSIRHRKVQTGKATYYCTRCNETVKFVENNP
jgi:SprT protein